MLTDLGVGRALAREEKLLRERREDRPPTPELETPRQHGREKARSNDPLIEAVACVCNNILGETAMVEESTVMCRGNVSENYNTWRLKCVYFTTVQIGLPI